MSALQFRSIFTRRFSNAVDSGKVGVVYDHIVNMNLGEVNALVEKIKSTFNISTVGNIVAAAPTVAPTTTASAPKETKSDYCVILQKIDPSNKAKIIREIKVILPSLNLVEAKNFVESAPKLIKDKVKQEEANAIKASLEALGAQISLE